MPASHVIILKLHELHKYVGTFFKTFLLSMDDENDACYNKVLTFVENNQEKRKSANLFRHVLRLELVSDDRVVENSIEQGYSNKGYIIFTKLLLIYF